MVYFKIFTQIGKRMNKDLLKKLGKSALRIVVVLAIILGVPAYEDAGVGYHHPQVENINSALQGISASDRKNEVNGIAIYCEWEMNEDKWQIWRKFIR